MSPNCQTSPPWLTRDIWGLQEMVLDPAFSRHQSEMHQPGQEEQIQRAVSTLVVVYVGECLSKTVSMESGHWKWTVPISIQSILTQLWHPLLVVAKC